MVVLVVVLVVFVVVLVVVVVGVVGVGWAPWGALLSALAVPVVWQMCGTWPHPLPLPAS